MNHHENKTKSKYNKTDEVPDSVKSAKEFANRLNAPIVSQLTGILSQDVTIEDYKLYLLHKY